MIHRRLILSFILFITFTNSFSQEIRCKIWGTTVGRNSRSVYIKPDTEDPLRFEGVEVPVINDRFEFEMHVPYVQRYNLIFSEELEKGSWVPVGFFPEEGMIGFTLHNMESAKFNVISGGALNSAMAEFGRRQDSLFLPVMKPYSKEVDSLWAKGRNLSRKADSLVKRLDSFPDDFQERSRLFMALDKLRESGGYYSERVTWLMSKLDSVERIKMYWKDDYISKHVDLFSYSMIYSMLQEYSYNKVNKDLTFLNDIYPVFAKKYPSHPYTKKVGEMLAGANKIKAGSHYIDFEAQTVTGETVKLSDSITGRVALIDLWATWCGPCRGLNRNMIPVYEKYRSRGFVIIGVACEYKTTDAFRHVVKAEKYPWTNLVELDNRNGIWSRYNLSAAGCTYLVDENGIIVAIHPDADELDRILDKMLK